MPDEPLPRALLVEGPDDKHVVLHLCKKHKYSTAFEIIVKNGFEPLKAAIRPELKVPGRTALGILVDANSHPDRPWQQIRHQLEPLPIDVPRQMQPNGTVIQGSPTVGVWLMPDNASPGQLEDFVRTLIPACDPVWPRAKRYINGIPATERKFSPAKTQRAMVYAWLAACEEPHLMGAAINIGDLDAEARTASQFLDWLRRTLG
ncbi:MAG: hypothetical protein OXN89_23855 [Bryobacterales bacterium]|nr:hypothetical protein [Bryobacterales bacterium]